MISKEEIKDNLQRLLRKLPPKSTLPSYCGIKAVASDRYDEELHRTVSRLELIIGSSYILPDFSLTRVDSMREELKDQLVEGIHDYLYGGIKRDLAELKFLLMRSADHSWTEAPELQIVNRLLSRVEKNTPVLGGTQD